MPLPGRFYANFLDDAAGSLGTLAMDNVVWEWYFKATPRKRKRGAKLNEIANASSSGIRYPMRQRQWR